MTDTNLNFAKIVANPTPFGWSQVYSAGKLFAAISLEKAEETEEKDYLNILGKEILNTLEQEFFTLETKDLESIRQAVLTTSSRVPKDVVLSFVIGSVTNNILYLYILGNGKADIKRDGSLGTLLQASDQQNDSLKEASGYLQEKDVIILQTKQFSEVISEAVLSEFLESPSIADAAENLAPVVKEKESPTSSSIIAEYKLPVNNELTQASIIADEQTISEDAVLTQNKNAYELDQNPEKKVNPLTSIFSVFKNLPKINTSGLSHPRKIILLVVGLIIIIFAASIFFAVKKQDTQKVTADFQNTYPKAEKKYEEGQSLVDLNQALAKDSFDQAKNILETSKDKFPKDSTQEKQILTLLTKVNDALGNSAKSSNTNATEAKANESTYLSNESKNAALDYTKDDKNIYFITSKAISSIPSAGTDSKELIKNNSDWKSIGGLATYNTNLYVLDKDQNQIIKFLNNGAAYSKSDYLSASAKADFTKAVSITTDNNIYVLFTDGTITKYFKGNAVDFSLNGLDKPLLSPTKIYSTPDFDNIYILDKGNGRVVVFDKKGLYKAQYLSPIIKSAKDFEVLESDKKVYILSGSKIYKINL